MGGTMRNIFNWNFCITDQKNRVDIIQKVYGIPVEQYPDYKTEFIQYRWVDMQAATCLKTTVAFTAHLNTVSPESLRGFPATNADTGGVPGSTPVIITPYMATFRFPEMGLLSRLPRPVHGENEMEDPEGGVPDIVEHSPQISLYEMYFAYPNVVKKVVDLREEALIQAQLFVDGKKNTLKSCTDELNEQIAILRAYALELAVATGYSTSRLNWTYRFDKDAEFNEVIVDFR
jgi:hypothetical protein